MIITGKYPSLRLRRSRQFDWSRRLIQESDISYNDLILPIFLIEGNNKKIPIKTMPGVYRYSVNKLPEILIKQLKKIPMIALFPYTNKKLKNKIGSEALNENNVIFKAIRYIKKSIKIILE